MYRNYPPPFERARYTDDNGKPVEIAGGGPSTDTSSWRICVSSHTDPEGWEYSTGFSRISGTREGGRASKRATDTVRRRKWTKSQEVGNLAALRFRIQILQPSAKIARNIN